MRRKSGSVASSWGTGTLRKMVASESMRAFSGGGSSFRSQQKAHEDALDSGATSSKGRCARPGTDQTSVPEKGLICFKVPSGICVNGENIEVMKLNVMYIAERC